MVVEICTDVEADSDCESIVGSVAMGILPPPVGIGRSDVVDSADFSFVEVPVISVGQALAVVVISGWTEESVNVVSPSEVNTGGTS